MNLLQHIVYTVITVYSSGLNVVKGFIQSAFLFPGWFDDAHTFNRIENLLEMRKDGLVLDIDCELRQILLV